MNILFLFLDGVGLGVDNPSINPFSRAEMPNLRSILEGGRLLIDVAPYHGPRASLLALDACLGVGGVPQSATGQAVLLTGQNVPEKLGYHYGPKPNPPIVDYLTNGNLFSLLKKMGLRTAFINAYPPRYFEGIRTGRRLYSAIPLAATSAGINLMTTEDLHAGQALSADFTGQGWHDHLNLRDIPILTPRMAGNHLERISYQYDFTFFEYWLSDYAGHHQNMLEAVSLLETFDQVIGGLLETWNDEQGIVLITSDHGNLEDLSTRRHTRNLVPAIMISSPYIRESFFSGLSNLTHITPAIINFLSNRGNQSARSSDRHR
jgi:2,3-bisphosphoglycerate-independent phosphoglycerate mutase